MINILKEIENKYPVNMISVNGEEIWPLIRIKYHYEYRKNSSINNNSSFTNVQSFNKKINDIKKIFYGWKSWFKRYDFLAISSSREGVVKIIDNKYYDRLIDPIIDILNKDKFLYIERPFLSHHPIKDVYEKNVVSYYPILFLSYIFNKFIKLQSIEGKNLLEAIKREYNIKFNEEMLLKKFIIRKKVFKNIYKFLKPKILFVMCYYDNMAAIKAAKEMGIIVVEVQHGLIGTEHPAYNILIDLDDSYFPDYILVFGKGDVTPFYSSTFIDTDNVYPVGSYYLEYIKTTFKPDRNISKKLSKYKRSIGVTLQWTVEEKTIKFILDAARLDDSICYVLIPRQPVQKEYSGLELPENVKVITDKGFYEVIMNVDFHSTVYSTCALEAPSLGIQNIMINIDNISMNHYGNILRNEDVTKYVDTPEEYVNTINSFMKLDTETIIQSNEDNIVPNYKNNLEKFLNKLDIE